MSLKGKVAVITGGSKGIGRATALKLAAEGASIVINYGRDSEAAKEVIDKIGSDRALAVQADAGSIPGIESLVKQTIDRFGKIDILMPNAGVMLMRDLEHTTEEDFDRTFNLNVKGPFFLAQVNSSPCHSL
jgi:3-oxoacyl-[acyl-carrier protein] reductase